MTVWSQHLVEKISTCCIPVSHFILFLRLSVYFIHFHLLVDTDSLIIKVKTVDLAANLQHLKNTLDTSNFVSSIHLYERPLLCHFCTDPVLFLTYSFQAPSHPFYTTQHEADLFFMKFEMGM